jgi:hypothetical protein
MRYKNGAFKRPPNRLVLYDYGVEVVQSLINEVIDLALENSPKLKAGKTQRYNAKAQISRAMLKKYVARHQNRLS